MLQRSPETVALLTRISAKVIDGAIIAMAVLGSMSYALPPPLAVVASVFVTVLAVTLVHTYAETLNQELKESRITSWSERWALLVKQRWMMASTLVPAAFFGLAVVRLITPERAFRWTEIGLVVVLFGFGFLSRRMSGGSIGRASVYGAGAVALGLVLVEVKQWAKYLPELQ